MKAIVQERYGSADVLAFTEVDMPVATGTQVLVRVHAAAVNARDWHIMRGDPYLARVLGRPSIGVSRPRLRIRGTDFAGRVAAVGPDVTGLHPGDEVYGEVHGALAEYVCAPQDVLARMPANLSFEQAAAVPLAGNTALVGLRDAARLRPGQRVLINGGSGGVGTFAVQIAKASGAAVTAVCSTRNVDLVGSLGADRVIDYRREDFARGAERYDVVFDLVGNRSLADCRRVLAPGGTLVLAGGGNFTGGSVVGPIGLVIRGMLLSRFVRHRLVVLAATPSRANLEALRDLIESGQVTPVIDRTFPLCEAAEAIRYLEGEHARAKVIVTV
jgi:NADPH:quinone reductase-like Zn-dependent oxidoreductase